MIDMGMYIKKRRTKGKIIIVAGSDLYKRFMELSPEILSKLGILIE